MWHGLFTRNNENDVFVVRSSNSDSSDQSTAAQHRNEEIKLKQQQVPEGEEQHETSSSAFHVLAGNIALCLMKSDIKRLNGLDGAATGWTSWVDEKSATRIQNCIDKLILSLPENPNDPTNIELLEE